MVRGLLQATGEDFFSGFAPRIRFGFD